MNITELISLLPHVTNMSVCKNDDGGYTWFYNWLITTVSETHT